MRKREENEGRRTRRTLLTGPSGVVFTAIILEEP
jgi:hypothetical protein